MQSFEAIDADAFLAKFWQKQAITLRQTYPDKLPGLSPDEIAWLATQADVESRLVITSRKNGHASYRVEQGPFSDERLSALPESDWTLLVQDVDKHLPAFRQWFSYVDFVPDWRIDDLMVSVAAAGGSAGPHRDDYDVFLCQGQGHREWRVAAPDQAVADAQHPEMALLEPFEDSKSFMASQGQVLYLPAGVPHWGIARDLCVTYSIGMRAPTKLEIACGVDRVFPDRKKNNDRREGDDKVFYSDPDLRASESLPGCISTQSILRARDVVNEMELSDSELAMGFGCVVTDPKAWLEPEQLTADEASEYLRRAPADADLPVHGMASTAWFACGEDRLAFANGYGQAISASQLVAMKHICMERRLSGASRIRLESNGADADFLAWLCRRGVFDTAESEASEAPPSAK